MKNLLIAVAALAAASPTAALAHAPTAVAAPAATHELGHVRTTLHETKGPVVVLIPRGGVSALDAPGGPFEDPSADRALFEAVTAGLAGHPFVRVEARDEHINDPSFAAAAARTLLGLLGRPGT